MGHKTTKKDNITDYVFQLSILN